MSVSDMDIGTRYRNPQTDIQHVNIGIEYCRYGVLFRTLKVPYTVIVKDIGIRYRYLNGQTNPIDHPPKKVKSLY